MEFTHSRSKSSFENLQVPSPTLFAYFSSRLLRLRAATSWFSLASSNPQKETHTKKKQWRLSMDSRPVTTKVGSGVPGKRTQRSARTDLTTLFSLGGFSGVRDGLYLF